MSFSFKQAPDLMQRLNSVQNHEANEHQDITTFAGFCATRDELERHVVFYENKVAAWVPPVRRRASRRAVSAGVFMANWGSW